ncbi:hypothetical protein ZIOFF_054115 [Zingiber officinale]|uniref:Calcium uniporter protein C-terminal domain-containing protein n=1 Tax=Zingiber officinale TaxID=94328 RepID=A0A8J5KQT0_ZINOF|nr:hypothetical protein ZIOFF_054115 [Zingiber officinale]
MEKAMAEIDRSAATQVRRELWCGLAFLVAQTGAFARLTFWELSWDVMEPICFYVTSIYFMAGYTFFLRTSKEPPFEGFLEGRLVSRQKRLMVAGSSTSNPSTSSGKLLAGVVISLLRWLAVAKDTLRLTVIAYRRVACPVFEGGTCKHSWTVTERNL